MPSLRSYLIILFFCSSWMYGQEPSPADCDNAILICGNINFGLDPSGVGFDEFSLPGNVVPPCYAFNNSTVWLRFVIAEDGQFTFDLIPESANADYDFAIYGPNVSCTELGSAIRCSSTNPQAAGVGVNTGLNFDEIDHFEGPGADGNGYLQYLDVLEGEEYIMIIGRPHGDGGFGIQMTGTAQLPQQPMAFNVDDIVSCESDEVIDGSMAFDLEMLVPEIVQSQTDVTVTFHESLNDANIGVNPLMSPYENITNPQTIYYRVENDMTGCFGLNDFEVSIEDPFQVTLPQGLFLCDTTGDTIKLFTEPGYAYYEWSTGEEGPDLNSITVSQSGEYYVVVTDQFGCKVKTSTVVDGSTVATITDIIINEFSGTENSIEIIVEGPGDYEYALNDDFIYQDSNIFTGLLNGYHTVYVRDKNGCGVVSRRILILDYPRFFTPNGDGVHDLWNIVGMEEFATTEMYIFDRYGKLIKQVSPLSSGWDGTYQGNPLPSNDYWFAIYFEDGRVFKGHFTLKR